MTVKWPRNRTEGPQGSSRTYFKSRNQPDARPCVSGAPVAAEGWDGLLKKKKWKIASHFQRTVLRCDRQVAQELNRGASRVIPDLLQVQEPTRRRQIPVFACLTPPWRPKARFLPETLQFPRWTVLRCDRRQMAQELNSGASRVIPDLLQVQEPTGCAPLRVWRPRGGRRVGWPLKKRSRKSPLIS